MKKLFSLGALVLSAFLLNSKAQATPISPLSYSMPNGYGQAAGGTYNYWDLNYGSGSHTIDGAMLNGSLGQLTDGYVTTQNWFNVENVSGTGPYVGWKGIDPTIKFFLPSTYDVTKLRIHFDSANFGNVAAPSKIMVDGNEMTIIDPVGDEPFWAEFDLNYTGDTLEIQILRGDHWIFADEITLDGTEHRSVPEPTSVLLLLLGLGVIALRWVRKYYQSTVVLQRRENESINPICKLS